MIARRLAGGERPRKYYAAEAWPALKGYIHGTGDGFGKGLFVMRTGLEAREGREAGAEVETPPRELWGHGTNPLNWGPRFLRAATAMMETAGQEAELQGGAMRRAMAEGLRGAAARARAAELLAHADDVTAATCFGSTIPSRTICSATCCVTTKWCLRRLNMRTSRPSPILAIC